MAETREEKLEEKMSSTEAEIKRLQDCLLSREAQLEAAVEDLAAATREQQVFLGGKYTLGFLYWNILVIRPH